MALLKENRHIRTHLPSDPNFLLSYMAGIASDELDDDFEGYLTDKDEPLCIVALLKTATYLAAATFPAPPRGSKLTSPSQHGKYTVNKLYYIYNNNFT